MDRIKYYSQMFEASVRQLVTDVMDSFNGKAEKEEKGLNDAAKEEENEGAEEMEGGEEPDSEGGDEKEDKKEGTPPAVEKKEEDPGLETEL